MKTLLFVAAFAVLLIFPSPARAQVYIGLGIRLGPPPPREEKIVVVRPYPEAVWVAGYYDWNPRRQRYFWIRGHWVRPPRAHVVWLAPRWEQRNGEWVHYKGRWQDEQREARGGRERH